MSELSPNSRTITDPDVIREFVLAGNSTFTLKSLKSGEHYTYCVRRTNGASARTYSWFVDAVVGYKDRRYIGLLVKPGASMEFRKTRGSKLEDKAEPILALQWFSHWVLNQGYAPAQLEFRHEGRCGRCGRELTHPDSIDRGIGPECISKMGH